MSFGPARYLQVSCDAGARIADRELKRDRYALVLHRHDDEPYCRFGEIDVTRGLDSARCVPTTSMDIKLEEDQSLRNEPMDQGGDDSYDWVFQIEPLCDLGLVCAKTPPTSW